MPASLKILQDNFPHNSPRPRQQEALAFISGRSSALIEMPTGEGKTGVGWAALKALSAEGKKGLFYVTPTKMQVDQLKQKYAGAVSVCGRAEYPCLFYDDAGIESVSAEASPCYTLDCKHRVDQGTGRTQEEGATPCPYFQAKYEAKQAVERGEIVVSTTAFFLHNRLLVKSWREMEPALVVVDEAHGLANLARRLFEYTLTDYHLYRVADLLENLDKEQAKVVKKFAGALIKLSHTRPSRTPALLDEKEIEKLITVLQAFDTKGLEKELRKALADGRLDPVKDRTDVKAIEGSILNIPRFLRSLEYALGEEGRKPLNLVIACYYNDTDPEVTERTRVRTYVQVRGYYVAPIIKKAMGERVLAYSATIGNEGIWSNETGLKLPFLRLSSSFETARTRVFQPIDTPDLSFAKQGKDGLRKALKAVVEAATKFAQNGIRSLIVVASDDERQNLMRRFAETGVTVVTYGEARNARQAALAFKAGEGQVLIGTAAQYAEGTDFPAQIAPVIFFLRPGYPPPSDPMSQFEKRRFPEGTFWALQNWRVMIQALQVRGRNIRGEGDMGVCFFVSQQFRRFLLNALPEWLKPAYKGQVTMAQAVDETVKMLKA